jgi:predicted nucleic acid-binding protein
MPLPDPDLIYVDASGWIALVNRRDEAHHQAIGLYRQHLIRGGHFITTSAVLLEMGN